jgi:trigger factor
MDVSSLQISLEEGTRWSRTLSIVVPADLVQSERQNAVKKLAKQIKIPGFRAGKVPSQVIEKRFGPAINQELVDRVVNEAFREVLKERDLRPISEGQVSRVDFDGTADLSFDVQFEVAPEITLGTTGGFKIERPAVNIGDEQVTEVLARLREQHGTWVPATKGKPKDGDRVQVRIQRLDDSGDEPRPYEFVLGKNEAIPDIEVGIRTLSIGKEGDFTITFPDDFPTEEKRGQQDSVRIFLDGRKTQELPALDDAFAGQLGDFESLDALRTRVQEDLRKEAERESEGVVRQRLLEALVDANPFEAPHSMVDHYIRSLIGEEQKLSEAQMTMAREQLGTQADAAVKTALVLEAYIAKKEIKVSEEDVDTRIEEMATRAGTEPGALYTRLQKSGQLERLERELLESQAFEALASESTITEAA